MKPATRRRMTTRHLCFGALLLVAGCSSAPTLRPSPRADRVIGLEAAAQASDGQTGIVVLAGEWPGDAEIELEVTPLKVRIENE